MPAPDPRPRGSQVTLPQLFALIAIWTAVIYGVTAKRPAGAEEISLKAKPALAACAKQG